MHTASLTPTPITLSVNRVTSHNRMNCAVCCADADRETADFLQELKVKIIAPEVCQRPDWYGDPEYKFDPELMMCAGYGEGKRDSCEGDSGGPLQCIDRSTGRWKLAGLTSFGDGCAVAKKPGVYTKIATFFGWINEYFHGNCSAILFVDYMQRENHRCNKRI